MTKTKKCKKNFDTELETEYTKRSEKNLFLDKPFMALSNLSKKKKGKEVPVNVQISDYLKSMKLLEKSTREALSLVDKIDKSLSSTYTLVESRMLSKNFKGRKYTTTKGMIDAVKLYESGKISRKELRDSASWAEDPDSVIEVAQMIAGIGRFRK
jgi:hypothetical protein